MTTRVWLMEIKCPQAHCIAINAFEAENDDDALQMGKAMGEEFAGMVENGEAPDCCALCDSSEFLVHLTATIFTDLETAKPAILKLHRLTLAEQRILHAGRN